jgi:LDH2 family malate/lactate/ureidoglycolate dehydrogenase
MASDILSDVMAGARFLTGISSWTDNIDAPQQLGHFFLLIDPARLIGRDQFANAMASFSETVRSATPADPVMPVMLPGEREQTMMAEAARLGVPLKDDILAKVKALADA